MNWRKRLPEWISALRRARGEGAPIPWLAMLRGIAFPVPRSVWRERLRHGCFQCPLFDREGYICRGVMGPMKGIGCGCFVPFKALSPEPYEKWLPTEPRIGCYGRAKFGFPFGWPGYTFPTRWAKYTAFIRFLFSK